MRPDPWQKKKSRLYQLRKLHGKKTNSPKNIAKDSTNDIATNSSKLPSTDHKSAKPACNSNEPAYVEPLSSESSNDEEEKDLQYDIIDLDQLTEEFINTKLDGNYSTSTSSTIEPNRDQEDLSKEQTTIDLVREWTTINFTQLNSDQLFDDLGYGGGQFDSDAKSDAEDDTGHDPEQCTKDIENGVDSWIVTKMQPEGPTCPFKTKYLPAWFFQNALGTNTDAVKPTSYPANDSQVSPKPLGFQRPKPTITVETESAKGATLQASQRPRDQLEDYLDNLL